MNQKELEVVLALPAAERYAYFADFEEVWGLYDGGWALSEVLLSDLEEELMKY